MLFFWRVCGDQLGLRELMKLTNKYGSQRVNENSLTQQNAICSNDLKCINISKQKLVPQNYTILAKHTRIRLGWRVKKGKPTSFPHHPPHIYPTPWHRHCDITSVHPPPWKKIMPKPRIKLSTCSTQPKCTNNSAVKTHSCYSETEAI